jgi:hypothetical protein
MWEKSADYIVHVVFSRWNTEIVGSNPTWGMDLRVRLFCVYAVLCVGSGLATDWSLVQLCKKIKELKKRPRSNKGVER